MSTRGRPVVGIVCDHKIVEGLPFDGVGEKYIEAVCDVADALPLLIPVMPRPLDMGEVLTRIDGLFLTGSASNVAPERYGGPLAQAGSMLDPLRDATSLPLITAAIANGLPLFGICRGMQELNVALGGTLDAEVHEIESRFDHREDADAPEEERYGPAHDVEVVPGGLIARLTGERSFKVNSLHGQAISRLAPGLAVDARAEDGTIEAVSWPDAPGFVLGVQWHPEWRATANPISVKLLKGFGEALRQSRLK